MTDLSGQETAAWNGASPLTRCVVAAFGGEVSPDAPALSPFEFLASFSEVFGDSSRADMVKAIQWSGRVGMQNVLLNKLEGVEPEAVGTMAKELGQLAGGTDGRISLAEQVGQVIKSGRTYNAKPALQVLSELAASRFVTM